MLDNISDKQLKWGYWWVLHRAAMHRLVVVILSLFAFVFCGYALWQITDWLANRQAEEEAMRQLVNQNINTEEYRRTNSPSAPEVHTVTAVPAANGLYDLIAEVKNPNIKWAITDSTFTFTAEGQIVQGSAYFLPLEEKYLVKLGVALRTRPQQLTLTFDNINWKRIRDLTKLTVPTFNITDQQIEQVTPAEATSPTATKLTFNLENSSPDSFWQVGLTAILSRSGSIQAVGQQVIANVESKTTRQVEFYWPESVIVADNLIIKPEVNVLDPRVLK
ncbi:MAG: hypothetical protein UV69_C0011G0012 [Parcubacteria group bacterium GW2011_GWE2_43_12]|nr:MAG: hypothetical protein UV69_C0011G0012 [Parcubacteria group bacterium GW2011_GWE2_43_12]